MKGLFKIALTALWSISYLGSIAQSSANFTVQDYSGVPTINVPIYTFESGDIKVPVSLSYNASGVKLNEIANSVGLGWKLNAGGAITRVIRGIPDDRYNAIQKQYGWLVYIGEEYPDGVKPSQMVDALNPEASEVEQEDAIQVATGGQHTDGSKLNYDLEPDIFNININGRSIQFLFDKDGVARTIPYQDVKITYHRTNEETGYELDAEKQSPINRFYITDELGYTYNFGGQNPDEETGTTGEFEYAAGVGDGRFDFKYSASVGSEESHRVIDNIIVAWYLHSITSPTNEVITFAYEPITNLIYDKFHQTCRSCPQDATTILNDFTPELFYSYRGTTQESRGRLKSIEGNDLKIDFVRDETEREDHDNDYRLKSIKVYSKKNDAVLEEPFKTFELAHSYFVSDIAPLARPSVTGDIYKRLRLDALTEYTGDNAHPPTEFYYTEQIMYAGNLVKLPHRRSVEIDLFGYYNMNGAKHLFPKLYVYPSLTGADRFRWFKKAGYANTDGAIGDVGVQYILGGADRSTNPNTVLLGSLNSIKFSTGGSVSFELESKDYIYDNVISYGGGLRLKKVTIDDGLSEVGDDVVREYVYNDVYSNSLSSGRLNGIPVVAYVENFDDFESASVGFTEDQLNAVIPPAEYFRHFTVKSSSGFAGFGLEDGATVGYRYITEITPGSGKKVAKYYVPEFRDCLLSEGVSGEYDEFETLDCNEFRFSETKFIRAAMKRFRCENNQSTFCDPDLRHMHFDSPNSIPFAPNINYNWKRGLNLSTRIYNQANIIISESKNDYITIAPYGNAINIQGLRYKFSQNRGLTKHEPQQDGFLLLYSKYDIVTSIIEKLSKVTIKTYDINGENPVTVETNYNYTDDAYLKSTSVTNSNGDVYKSYNTYPFEIVSLNEETIPKDDMSHALWVMTYQRHIKGAVIERVNTKIIGSAENVVGASLVTYKSHTENLICLPTGVYSLEFPNANPILLNDFVGANIQTEIVPGGLAWNFHKDNNYHLGSSIDLYNSRFQAIRFHQNYDNPISIQYDIDNTVPEATFYNAKHAHTLIGDECSYAGFESGSESGTALAENDYWKAEDVLVNNAHTGMYSLQIPVGYDHTIKSFIPTNQKQKYKFSGWVKTTNNLFGSNKGKLSLVVDGTSAYKHFIFGSTNNQWEYFEIVVDLSSITGGEPYTIECKVKNEEETYGFLLDDLRFQPYESIAVTATYDENRVLTSTSNINNIPAYIEYDVYYRPKLLRDEDRNIVSAFQYNMPSDISITDLNSITNTVPTIPVQNSGDLSGLVSGEKLSWKLMADGLNRGIQSTMKDYTPDHKDMVSTELYNSYGENTYERLPYAIANGDNFDTYTLPRQKAFYYHPTEINPLIPSTNFAFSYVNREASPLRRGKEASAPGEDWAIGAGHTTKASIRGNYANEILDWEFDGSVYSAKAAAVTRYYSIGTLYASERIDENGHKIISYSDLSGKTICVAAQVSSLSPQYGTSDFTYTYYVYDIMDRLVYIIPPACIEDMRSASDEYIVNSTYLSNWISSYKYDYKNRIIETKSPEKDATYIVYDKLNRVKLVQDGNLRTAQLLDEIKGWKYIKYDVLGRAIQVGVKRFTYMEEGEPVPIPYTQEELQSINNQYTNEEVGGIPYMLYEKCSADGTHAHNGYTSNLSYPVDPSSSTLLTVVYYDDYDYNQDGFDDVTYTIDVDYSSNSPYPHQCSKLTGIKNRNISASNEIITSDWYYTYPFYDSKDRVIQAATDLHIEAAQEIYYAEYDFTGKILKTKTIQQLSTPLTVQKFYEYDHAQRLKKIQLKVNSEPMVTMAQYNYNDLGQLVEKNLHYNSSESKYLQSVDYRYNIRGWLTKINESTCTGSFCMVPKSWLDDFVIGISGPSDWTDHYGPVVPGGGQTTVWGPGKQARRTANNLMAQLIKTEGFSDEQFIAYSYTYKDSADQKELMDIKYPDSILTSMADTIALPAGEFTYFIKPYIINYARSEPDELVGHDIEITQIVIAAINNFVEAKAAINEDSLIALTNYIGGNHYIDIQNSFNSLLIDSNYSITWRMLADSISPLVTTMIKNAGIDELQFRNYAYRMDSTDRAMAYDYYEDERIFDSIADIDYVQILLKGKAFSILSEYDSTCLLQNDLLGYELALGLDTSFLSVLQSRLIGLDSLEIALYDSLFADTSYEAKLRIYRQYYSLGITKLLNDQYPAVPGTVINAKSIDEREELISELEKIYDPDSYAGRLMVNSEFKKQFLIDVSTYLAPILATYSARQLSAEKRKAGIHKALKGYLGAMGIFKCRADGNDQNPDLFAMQLNYTTPNSVVGASAQYNGNVSWAKWSVITEKERMYGYEYDAQDRLKKAAFAWRGADCTWQVPADQRYSMPNVSYDANGNITAMKQYGVNDFVSSTHYFGLMDDLSYYYSGNKLIGVNDAAPNAAIAGDFGDDGHTSTPIPTTPATWEYEYDANGNMISDANKELTIAYNMLNQPATITNADGETIEYTYSALGEKLREIITPQSPDPIIIRDYVGSVLYNTTIVSSVETHEVDYIHTEEGRVTKQSIDWQYEYTITDQLGNSRVSFADADNNGVPEVIQRDDYYPFGLAHAGLSTAIVGPRNMYLFNGQELQQALKLNWADHGYRRYDVQIGRWNAADPVMKTWESPYAAMYNNPISFGDYDGADPSCPTCPNNGTGNGYWTDGGYISNEPTTLHNFEVSSMQNIAAGSLGNSSVSQSTVSSSSQAFASSAGAAFAHQANYIEDQQLPSSKDRSLDGITAAIIEFMEVMPIEPMSTMSGGSSTTPSSPPDPNQTSQPTTLSLFGPSIIIHIAEKRDESTFIAKLKIALDPFQDLHRTIETELEDGYTVYWEINANGDIDLGQMRFKPVEINIGSGVVRLLRHVAQFRSSAQNMINFVRNSPLIKNPALRQQLEKFYRATASIGNGSSTAALLHEVRTGQLLSGSGHLQKVALMRNWLMNLLKTGSGLTDFEKSFILREIVEANRAMRAATQPGSGYLGPVTKEIMKIINKYPIK